MKRLRRLRAVYAGKEGSALIMATSFIAVISLLVIVVVNSVVSRVPVTYQEAGWQQARLASEAGIGSTLDYMNANAGILTGSASWPGWKLADGTTAASGSSLAISGSANPATNISGSSATIYSGTNIVTSSGTEAYVNVGLKAVYPTYSGTDSAPWFIVRAMGTAPLSGPARTAPDKRDVELRRVSLKNIRSSLSNELPATGMRPPWWGQRATASRVIQVLVKPNTVGRFSFAIFTQSTMNWGQNGKFYTDSYNSKFSPGGDYPGGTIDNNNPAAAHSFGNIGTNSSQPQAITTNGGTVKGSLQTPKGAYGWDQNGTVLGGVLTAPEVTFLPPKAPSTLGWPYASSTPATIPVAGTTTLHYTTAGALTFTGTGKVTLVVDSSWSIGNGKVIVPPSVHASVYVGGNIDFGNGNVNDPGDPANSGKPGDLLIYGTTTTGGTAYSGHGAPVVSACIYAPTYDVSVKGGGNGTFYGSLVVNSYDMNGGGNLSLHYDESLSEVGPQTTVSFGLKSYFEDNRL